MADPTTVQGLRRSPLQDLATELAGGLGRTAEPEGSAVRIQEWPFLGMVSIRVAPGSDVARRLEGVLGTGLPRSVGEVTHDGAHSVLWLGPDEWLVVTQADAVALVDELRAAADGGHAAVVDVSANRTLLEVAGTAARDVLEKGCPADLHPRAFADDTAITTTLARVPVLLWKVDGSHFRVLPRASFAAYVGAWLLDAAQEFAAAGAS